MTPEQDRLARRLREALADKGSVRVVPMFGGLAFMLDDKLVMSAGKNGDLLVRAIADRHSELTSRPGASPAEMGAGRRMGRGWISVEADAIRHDVDLAFWLDVAIAARSAHRGRDRTRASRRRPPVGPLTDRCQPAKSISKADSCSPLSSWMKWPAPSIVRCSMPFAPGTRCWKPRSPPRVIGSESAKAVRNGLSHFSNVSHARRLAGAAGSSGLVGTSEGKTFAPAM